MFGSSLPSALGWLVATKVYSGTGADIVMESISRTNSAEALSESFPAGQLGGRIQYLARLTKVGFGSSRGLKPGSQPLAAFWIQFGWIVSRPSTFRNHASRQKIVHAFRELGLPVGPLADCLHNQGSWHHGLCCSGALGCYTSPRKDTR